MSISKEIKTMLELGKRKVQSSAGSFFVNIPILWVKNNQVKRGDLLEITLTDKNELIIKKAKERAT
ncbi:MAG: hypothetical protein IB616_04985 [Methanosarcinales archaeon]|nr:MAG: hypothetical protein IB616_04985 [Methanosarcinales archaeon]